MGRILHDEETTARSLVQVWRNEYADSLDARFRYDLVRAIHAGNTETAWERVREEEVRHVRARAEEWVAMLKPEEQPRWRRLFFGL